MTWHEYAIDTQGLRATIEFLGCLVVAAAIYFRQGK